MSIKSGLSRLGSCIDLVSGLTRRQKLGEMRLTAPRLQLKTARLLSCNIDVQLYRGKLTPRHAFEDEIASSFPPPSRIGINIPVCQATCDVVTPAKKQETFSEGPSKRKTGTSLLNHALHALDGVVPYCSEYFHNMNLAFLYIEAS
jgi:hypothetical protein